MRIPRQYLRSTLGVESFAGRGSRGAVYAPARDVRASVQPTTKLTADAQGNTIQAVLAAVVRPEEDIPVESRATYAGQQYRVTESVLMPDDFRPTHRELLLSRLG